MFVELDIVVLTHDVEEYNLKSGDIGTVVHVYKDKRAVEVEFITAKGKAVVLLTLNVSSIRPIERDETLHAR